MGGLITAQLLGVNKMYICETDLVDSHLGTLKKGDELGKSERGVTMLENGYFRKMTTAELKQFKKGK